MEPSVLRIGDRELTVIDGEPRARDLDLATWLGFDRPRNIRKLIERATRAGDMSPCCRSTVERQPTGPKGGGSREYESTTYWLTESESLLIASRSKTPKAVAVTKAVIAVFMAARRGLLAPPPPARSLPGGPPPSDIPAVALEHRFSYLFIETRAELLDEIEGMAAICRRAPMALQVAIARQLGDADPAAWAACRAELLAGLGEWAAEYGGMHLNTRVQPENREAAAHFAEQLACLLARAVRLLSD